MSDTPPKGVKVEVDKKDYGRVAVFLSAIAAMALGAFVLLSRGSDDTQKGAVSTAVGIPGNKGDEVAASTNTVSNTVTNTVPTIETAEVAPPVETIPPANKTDTATTSPPVKPVEEAAKKSEEKSVATTQALAAIEAKKLEPKKLEPKKEEKMAAVIPTVTPKPPPPAPPPPVKAAEPVPRRGFYRSQVELTRLEYPGITADQVAQARQQMQEQFAAQNGGGLCINGTDEDDWKKISRDMSQNIGGRCTTVRERSTASTVDAQLNCTGTDAGRVTITVQGGAAADRVTLNMGMTMGSRQTGGTRRIGIRVIARRTGDC